MLIFIVGYICCSTKLVAT